MSEARLGAQVLCPGSLGFGRGVAIGAGHSVVPVVAVDDFGGNPNDDQRDSKADAHLQQDDVHKTSIAQAGREGKGLAG